MDFEVCFVVIFLNCFGVIQLTKYDVVIVPEDVTFYPVGASNNLSLLFYNRPKYPTSGAQGNKDARSKIELLQIDDDDPVSMPEHRHIKVNNLRSLSRATPYLMHMYDEDKIVGGYDVDINEFPYHVSYGSNCAASIIDAKWAITAGHCGVKNYIKVGSKYFDKGTRYDVKKNHIHPNWDAKDKSHPFDYDFQLLELRNRISFGKSVQPIKLATISDMVVGTMMTVTGWGYVNEDGPYSDVLRAVQVPIIAKETCQKVSFPFYRGQLTSRMFCAGYSAGEKDACQGDSGGPAVANDRLLGIISFGYGCATPQSYGVYSKVAKVREWIEETTELRLE